MPNQANAVRDDDEADPRQVAAIQHEIFAGMVGVGMVLIGEAKRHDEKHLELIASTVVPVTGIEGADLEGFEAPVTVISRDDKTAIVLLAGPVHLRELGESLIAAAAKAEGRA